MSILETVGKIILVGGVAVAVAAPVALVLGWGLEAGIRVFWAGVLYVVAGAVLQNRLYEPISLSGFDSRPPGCRGCRSSSSSSEPSCFRS
jgi:hypothetical protein